MNDKPVVIPTWRRPAPKPLDASVVARRLIDLAAMVPAGRWVSYGDLADVYIVRHRENMVARGVASALSLRPVEEAVWVRSADDPQPFIDQWYVPWHRVRLTDGQAISRKYGIVSAGDIVNRMFVQEGGIIRHNAATDSCRFELVARVRADGGAGPGVADAPAAGAHAGDPDVRRRVQEQMARRRAERGW